MNTKLRNFASMLVSLLSLLVSQNTRVTLKFGTPCTITQKIYMRPKTVLIYSLAPLIIYSSFTLTSAIDNMTDTVLSTLMSTIIQRSSPNILQFTEIYSIYPIL